MACQVPSDSVWLATVMRMKIAEFVISGERDVKPCARRARLLAGLARFADKRRARFSKAVTNIARHLLLSSEQVLVEFGFSAQGAQRTIEVVFRCHGSAQPVDQLQGFSDLVDQFRFATSDQSDVVVRIGEHLAAETPTPADAELTQWGLVLQAGSAEAALIETHNRMWRADARPADGQYASEDLPARLALEASSLETLSMLSLVANKTDNLVMVLDRTGCFEWVNAAFVRLTGYGLHEIGGTQPQETLCGQGTSQVARRDWEGAVRMGHGFSDDLQLARKDGSPLWISLTLTPVTDESGNISRWIGVGTDITKRRLAHEVLEHAKAAAEAANRAKSEFLANMSHEIRTPMNAILGMTELALSTELSPDQRDYLETVKQSADALLLLLNDILDVSKIEAGKLQIESVPFDLGTLLTTTLGTLALRADLQGLQLSWQLPPEVPLQLVGDPHRLRQVVMNLVSNAIKFTEQGQVIVNVEKAWENDDEVSLHFSVADTGIGIAPDRLDNIFLAFEQADSSTTRRFGGTGLGLTICSQLVRLMGGKIWVQSQLGKGSCFHFSLRFRKNAEPPAPRERSDWDEPVAAQPKALEILVADDEAANRNLAAAILRRRGHHVRFAVNGREAVRMLAEHQVDLVLMDVQMPGMDGFEATAMLRERERDSDRHLPIVALTAHAMKGDREKCLAAGMDAYLPKPIKSVELLSLVECLATTGEPAVALDTAPVNASELASSIDFSAALDRLDNNTELLHRQMEFFLDDAPRLLDQVHVAITSCDTQTLRIGAHRLQGLAATFDAFEAVELAKRLEVIASSNESAEGSPAAALAQQLDTCIARVCEAIRAHLRR